MSEKDNWALECDLWPTIEEEVLAEEEEAECLGLGLSCVHCWPDGICGLDHTRCLHIVYESGRAYG